MEISKQEFATLVKNGFEKNDTDIINAFVDTYNQNFSQTIYNVTTCGANFGLQGFVTKAHKLTLYDLGCIYEDYKKNPERNTYFVVTGNGVVLHFVNYLDEFINTMYDDVNTRTNFMIASKHYNIMDASDRHDQKLVDAINKTWVDGTKRFWAQILYAIAVRDEEECKDKDIFVNSPEDALENAKLILERVCYNEDLKLILNYLCYFD